MGKVVLFIWSTVDGVVQGPMRPDEDTRDGFAHGGWAAPYASSVGSAAGSSMASSGGLLLGRRTYEDFFAVWPNRPKPNPFTDLLNNMQKYVASTTLKEPLPWVNSTLLHGDAAAAVARLTEQMDGDLVMLGSGELAQSLMRANLIDIYMLLICPVVLGAGQRLFREHGATNRLRLVETKTTDAGVVITTYSPAKPAARQ